MNLCKKNRIWRKLGPLAMAFFMTGMVFGGCGQATVYASEEAAVSESVEEAELEEYITENSEEPEEAEAEEPEESDDTEDTEQEDSDLSDGLTEEEDKETENKGTENVKKNPDFTIHAATDENTVKAGSDLVYTVTLENTGDVMLKNVQLQALFTDQNLQGEWYGDDLDRLDVGIRKELYLTVKIPEGQEKAVTLNLRASAEVETEEGEAVLLRQETSLETGVIPLKASFEVTKTADRSAAVPGDKILFQICIRNTGERTLHSAITTERFQLGNVPVQFLEKEGVVLNKAKTKARIEKIEPGKAAGLQAMVTLPKNIEAQDLLNEVVVTTLETGDQTVISQAKIRVKAAEKTKAVSEDSVDKDSGDTDESAVPQTGGSYLASTHPKTGDPYQPFLWLAMIPGSIIAAGWIRSRM